MGWSVGDVHYALGNRGHLAYRVGGRGPLNYVVVPGVLTSVDMWPDNESAADPDDPLSVSVAAMARIEEHGRCILFDLAGCGCSDPLPPGRLPSVEGAVEDLVAVIDAVGAYEVVANGLMFGATVAIAFAALHPERCRGLIIENGFARLIDDADYHIGYSQEQRAAIHDHISRNWGTGRWYAPNEAGESVARRNAARRERLVASPGTIGAKLDVLFDVDIRHLLGQVTCPTLIIQSRGSALVGVAHGEYLASAIPGARLLEVDSDDAWWTDEDGPALREWEEFITGLPTSRPPKRRLATLLFTDIVASTEQAAALGDRAWRKRLDTHEFVSTAALRRHNGALVKWTGDGVLALFDSASSALSCAIECLDESSRRGIVLRAGLHAGEVELRGDDIAGIAVHLAARVLALAPQNEILVSSSIPPLVEGARFRFRDFGDHELKGIGTAQHIHSVVR